MASLKECRNSVCGLVTRVEEFSVYFRRAIIHTRHAPQTFRHDKINAELNKCIERHRNDSAWGSFQQAYNFFPSNIFSISWRISARFSFNVLTSSNLRCIWASSTKDSKRFSCSRSGWRAWAMADSGSTYVDDRPVPLVSSLADLEFLVLDLGVGSDCSSH